jgi:hypothetical protein
MILACVKLNGVESSMMVHELLLMGEPEPDDRHHVLADLGEILRTFPRDVFRRKALLGHRPHRFVEM